MFQRRDVPVEGRVDTDAHLWGKSLKTPTFMRINRRFQAK